MEFPFNCEKLLGVDAEGFVIIDGKKGMNYTSQQNRTIYKSVPDAQSNFYEIIDKMGTASAKAQALPAVITTASRLFTSDNRLYLKAEGNKVLGLLKVGVKKLFIRNELGNIKEISPMCVLDFYVHESCQRNGLGKALFERMLQNESVKPEKLGYDRPSEKLLAFLAKHYGLKRYVPQNNNYVVYNAYFESASSSSDYQMKQQQQQHEQAQQQPNSFFNGFSNYQQQRRNGSQSQQFNQQQFAQTQYNQSQMSNPIVQKPPSSDIFGTQVNFNQKPPSSQQRQLPPKPQSKHGFESSSLTNAGGFQVFGSNQKQSTGSSQSIKRSSTTDRIFGGFSQEDYQKENNYKKLDQYSNVYQNPTYSQSKITPKNDSVGSLLQDLQSLDLNQQRQVKNAQEVKINKLSSKVEDTESKIKRQEEEIQQLMMKTGQIGYGQTTQQQQVESEMRKSQQGPTSFTAVGGSYMKRTQYATLNDGAQQRLSDNQQFVQLQKQINNGGNIPWGTFNYQFQHYRK